MKARYVLAGAVMLAVVVCVSSAWCYGVSAERRLRQTLESTIVSFSFDDQPLEQVAEYLSTLGSVNIVLDRTKIDPGQTVTLTLKNVPLETAIKFVAEGIGMQYVLRDGVVFISDEDGTTQEPVTRVYDVLDLVAELPDFVGPNFELGALSNTSSAGSGISSSGGGGIWGGAGGGGGGEEDTQGGTLQERTDALVELIKEVIAPGTWEEGGY